MWNRFVFGLVAVITVETSNRRGRALERVYLAGYVIQFGANADDFQIQKRPYKLWPRIGRGCSERRFHPPEPYL